MEGALALSLAAYLLPLRRLYQGSQKPKYPPLAPNLPLKQTLSTLGLHSFWKQQFHSSHCSAQSLGVILDSFCWYNTYSTHESQPSTTRTCPLVTTPMKVISPPTPCHPPTPHPPPATVLSSGFTAVASYVSPTPTPPGTTLLHSPHLQRNSWSNPFRIT